MTEKHRPYKDMPLTQLALRAVMFASMKDTNFFNDFAAPALSLANKPPAHPLWKKMHPVYKKITETILEYTAIRVFFGGVGLDQVYERAKKMIDKGIGVIVDYSAPEGAIDISEDTFDSIKNEYLSVCGTCVNLNYESGKNLTAMAIKISTLAKFEDLEDISKKLEEDFSGATLSTEEKEKFESIKARAIEIIKQANNHRINIYVDAEHSRINPIINKICFDALEEGRSLNVTVQAYLKDAPGIVNELLEKTESRPDLESRLGIKLVRGAYIGDKKEKGRIWHSGPEEDPIYDDESKKLTDQCYDESFQELYQSGRFAMITVATHNKESLRQAVASLSKENPTEVISATLLGFESLSTGGIESSKYVPYVSEKKEVLPSLDYTTRRAKEFTDTVEKGGKTRGELEYLAVMEEVFTRAGKGLGGFLRAANKTAPIDGVLKVFCGVMYGLQGKGIPRG